MSTEQNKAFIRRYLDAISGKPKSAALMAQFTTDEALVKHVVQAEAAFPEYRLEANEMVAEGDLVSVRGTVRGVHRGPFQGVPPTGKDLTFGLFITYRIAGGKIVEHWMLTDNLAMMQQLGMMPVPQH
jgi:predicted ester cyclase